MKSEKKLSYGDHTGSYEAEESAALYIPAGLTLGMFAGLVIGELVFSSMEMGMFIGSAAGALTGAVLTFLRLSRKER